MNKFRRAAILIGCPGPQTNFLKGVYVDLQAMQEFLLSPQGGSWHTHELLALSNPGVEEIAECMRLVTADYLFVYFSGHGFTNNLKQRAICLRDRNIKDLSLLNQSSRQLVVIDSCRNYIGGCIGGLSPQFGDPFESYMGPTSTREFFDRCIYQSPYGKMILHSTSSGRSSYDSPRGGYFTQALLTIGTNIRAERNFKPASIKAVAGFVPELLKRHGVFQQPQIVYSWGDLRVPFAVGLPTGVRSRPSRPYSQTGKAMTYNFSPWF